MTFPLTVPDGFDKNTTVEGNKPLGITSVIVTASAKLPLTCNVKSYLTTSPAFGFVGRPVFTKLITAKGVGVEVIVTVGVFVTVAVGEAVFVNVSVEISVSVEVGVNDGVSVHINVAVSVGVWVNVDV